MSSYSLEELSKLSRKELQILCKQQGLKANKKTEELLHELESHFMTEERSILQLEVALKDSDDLNSTWTIDEESNKENVEDANKGGNHNGEVNTQVKKDLMQEVERRTAEKLSKIPRIVADKVIFSDVPIKPVTPVGNKEKFDSKADSIDVYLAKKNQRALEQVSFNDKFKESLLPLKDRDASKSINKLRRSIVVDDEITFNVSKPQFKQVRRISPRLHDNANKIDKKALIGKSAQKNLGNKSPASFRFTTPKQQKTPKFDLQESLKKPLNYKPHTGKLKEVYFSQGNIALPRKPVAPEKRSKMQMSVKEMSRNITTRETKRSAVKSCRRIKRDNLLAKRRGIED